MVKVHRDMAQVYMKCVVEVRKYMMQLYMKVVVEVKNSMMVTHSKVHRKDVRGSCKGYDGASLRKI